LVVLIEEKKVWRMLSAYNQSIVSYFLIFIAPAGPHDSAEIIHVYLRHLMLNVICGQSNLSEWQTFCRLERCA